MPKHDVYTFGRFKMTLCIPCFIHMLLCSGESWMQLFSMYSYRYSEFLNVVLLKNTFHIRYTYPASPTGARRPADLRKQPQRRHKINLPDPVKPARPTVPYMLAHQKRPSVLLVPR